jgi:hypothetical protein
MTIIENDCDILDRHKPYVAALTASTAAEYYQLISDFLSDDQISLSNDDDREVFINLMLDTAFSKIIRIRFGYFDYLLSKIDLSTTSYLLPRYLLFLNKYSKWFVDDLFYSLIFENHIIMIEKVFNLLSTKDKLSLLRLAGNFPDVFKKSPRLRTYCIFS